MGDVWFVNKKTGSQQLLSHADPDRMTEAFNDGYELLRPEDINVENVRDCMPKTVEKAPVKKPAPKRKRK